MLSAFVLVCMSPAASSLTTAAEAESCPNEAIRANAEARLPDCRAYELVTPSDSNGRMLEMISSFTVGVPWDLFPTELGSPVKSSFGYLAYASALSEPGGGSGVFDVYRAERSDSGWTTKERLSRSSSDIVWTLPGGISSDHGYTFSNDHRIDYLRGPDGSYELTGLGRLNDEPYARGRYISPGGTHVLFTTGKYEGVRRVETQSAWCREATVCEVLPLESNSPQAGTGAVYDRSADGPTHVVSLLPGDAIPAPGQQAFYIGASRDATSVAFEIAGTLYVRADNGSEDERTEEVASGMPLFAGISDNGDYLFYVTGGSNGTIHRFNTVTEADIEINPVGAAEVVNVSADGSHIYFISAQQLDGVQGVAGEPNMYVWSGGSPEYVATVLPSDLVRTSGELQGFPALTTWTTYVTNPSPAQTEAQGPGADASRTTPSGSFLVFESRAQLTSYDNASPTDCGSWTEPGPDNKLGTPDDEVMNPEGRCTEIYRYDNESHDLECVSCNPSGEPPTSDARLQEAHLIGPPVVLHNLSDDGSRVFFETGSTLVDGDINGTNDIYEWQEEEGAPPIALITSGRSPAYPLPEGWESPFAPKPNLLMSVTPNGSDVYFTAEEALTSEAGENGTQGIYDARIDGGFAQPAIGEGCAEEHCRPDSSPSAPPTSGSGSEKMAGSGNVKPKKKQRCHRTRHKKDGRARQGSCSKRHGSGKKGGARKASLSVAPDGEKVAQDQFGAPAAPAGLDAGAVVNGSAPGEATSAALSSCSVADFGIEKSEVSLSSASAAAHPDFVTKIEFNHFQAGGFEEACAATEEVTVDLPPGLLGSPAALPSCTMGEFVSFGNCPAGSQVGVTKVRVGMPLDTTAEEPVYNLEPPHPDREVARFGFIADLYPVFIDVKVRTAGDYGATAVIHDPPGLGVVIRATTTLWGNPSGKGHDKQRFTPFEVVNCSIGQACLAENEERSSGVAPEDRKAFMTNPSACQQGKVDFSARSYQLPGQLFTASAPLAPITDCIGLPFAPSFEAEPTNHTAGAPTGLKTKLVLPQHLGAEERATSTMREARVTLPEGMQVAAGAANWIGTCSEAQVGYHEEVDTACPDNSKLGTATIVSPALSVPIEGTIYQRDPQPGRQLGLWLTADALGLHIKLPGSLEPDKTIGRLTAVFTDLPQVPVEEIDLNVWGGPRAPLQNPDHCGTFTTDFSFSPHSNDPAATGQSTMQITEGCNQGFDPSLHAGVTEPVAAKYSPFVFDLTRPDGNQALRGFELKLPDGELAKIKGVPLCSNADADAANCPQGSRIGSLQATTGPGPDPLSIPQPGKDQPQIYLSGPYQGAPFSIVTEVPAQAGPFDLGTLAVRSGLDVEPETGRAVVKADPLPQFFEGVGIAYRNLHAVVDRPEFSLNPTDCREMAVTSEVTSTQGAVAHPQARFQVDGCKALKFKPKLSLKLKGGTKRADYPALTAVLKARKGDANIAFASVALPHSEFLAQEHIGTICTRKQFAADKCPAKSVYGKAKAITPLLDKPLSGPVYLRSSDHPLPDLVAKLGGQLEIDLVGRIDSKHGGIRTTFESVPDAPVSKFVLQMRGGKKGLLTNSTDICRGSHRATVQMRAQNGRAANLRPKLASGGCGHKKHHR